MDTEPKPNVSEKIAKETNEALSLNVLAADDSEANRTMYQMLLKSLGHKVKIVEDGQLLLDELKGGGSYDLVFSDNTMPGKKGIEVLQEIRATGNKIPFILATTDTGTLETEANKLGGLYLAKP